MFEEKVIETKICKKCSTNFDITDKDLEFYDKISPKFNNEKFAIPKPNFCPYCREQRRMIWRNEMNMYRRKCDFSWMDIISMHNPEFSWKVYHNKYWWGNEHEGLDYWVEINLEKSIFSQVEWLIKVVPRLHRFCFSEDKMINSDYTNCAWDLKDCYLIFWAWRNESCMYSTYINDSNNCIDCLFTINSNNCYQSINISNCYNLFYSRNSEDCNYCFFISNCVSCSDCLWCVWLINKKYHILNKEYDKETYEIEKEKFLNNKELLKSEYDKLYDSVPKKYINWVNNENVVWDYIFDSKNVAYSYDISNAEDCKYCTRFSNWKDCMDFFSRWEGTELCYEVVWWWDKMYKCAFTAESFWCKNSFYLDLCVYCEDCFACVWLKNKQYCILNKQYTKEEYNKLVPKIIENMKKTWEWWEHFSSNMAPFWYNDSVVQKYYPLTKDQALKKWFKWSDYEVPFPKVEKIIPSNKLPENISDIPDDILNWAIECEITKKPFMINKQELDFYRKYNLPIPKKHPDERYNDRFNSRNPRKLYDRKCGKCEVEIKTTYSHDRKEIVYCEECYNKEFY